MSHVIINESYNKNVIYPPNIVERVLCEQAATWIQVPITIWLSPKRSDRTLMEYDDSVQWKHQIKGDSEERPSDLTDKAP